MRFLRDLFSTGEENASEASQPAPANTFETQASVYRAFATSADSIYLPDRNKVEKRLRRVADSILRHLDDDEAILHVIPFNLGTGTVSFTVLTTKRVFETETWSRTLLRNDVVGVRTYEIDAVGMTFHYVFILNQVAKDNLWAHDISDRELRQQPELKKAHDQCRSNIFQIKLNDNEHAAEHYAKLIHEWF